MDDTGHDGQDEVATSAPLHALCPFDLRVTPVARFLNCELVGDATYDGLELQYFDDAAHGRGMLAFLGRRADGRVDYYYEPGLRLDPASYTLGASVGAWQETRFEAARLAMTDDGVDAEAAFTDASGQRIELRVDDRDGRRRRRADLLAPVSAAIEHPQALLLVYVHGFDLVRTSGTPPRIRIDGREVATGRLPGERLHRRRLIKYGAPLTVAELNSNHDGPLASPAAEVRRTGDGITAVASDDGIRHAHLRLDPALPELATLPDGARRRGSWWVDVDGARLTGGTWTAQRRGDDIALALDVAARWRPGRLPPLMRLVTTVVPTFRRWPTTYRWAATVTLGAQSTMTSRWQRTGTERGTAYRVATGS